MILCGNSHKVEDIGSSPISVIMQIKCLNCGIFFSRVVKESNKKFLLRKFCSNDCCKSFRFRNKIINTKTLKTSINKKLDCKLCGLTFLPNKRENFCHDCKDKSSIDFQTKEFLFSNRKNWQSARSYIAKLARKSYNISVKPKECKMCGYTNHIEISHIKAVKDFPNDTLISEINNLNNLVALCPNHHWEFDNGLLQVSEMD